MIKLDCWISLLIAIPFGVLGTISMKLSDGLKKWKPSVALAISYTVAFVALTLALKGIDMSIVYAVWSGVGTVLVALVGILMFDESMSTRKIIALLLVVCGVLGIHLTNAAFL